MNKKDKKKKHALIAYILGILLGTLLGIAIGFAAEIHEGYSKKTYQNGFEEGIEFTANYIIDYSIKNKQLWINNNTHSIGLKLVEIREGFKFEESK